MLSRFYVIFFIIGAVCFIPAIIGFHIQDDSLSCIKHALSSELSRLSNLSGFCLGFPLLIQLFLYVYGGFFLKEERKSSPILALWILLWSLVIPQIALYIIVSYSNLLVLVPAIHGCRTVIIFACGVRLLNIYGKDLWRMRYMVPVLMIYSTSAVLQTIDPFLSSSSTRQHLRMTVTVFMITSMILFFFLCLRWLYYIISIKNSVGKLSIEERTCSAHLGCLILLVIGMFLNSHINGYTYRSRKQSFFVVTAIIYSVFVVFIFILTFQQVILDKFQKQSNREAEVKQMVAGYFSHEVRTPLNTAMMGLQILKRELTRVTFPHRSIETILEIEYSITMVVDILKDLITYERLESGGISLDIKEIPILPLLDSKLHAFRLHAKQKDIEFKVKFKFDPYQARINADEDRMQQVLRNLLAHALDSAGDHGKVQVLVDVVLSPVLDLLHIEICDSGPSISKVHQSKMFNGDKIEFTAGVIEAGQAGGLGLLISHRLMAMHQGSIAYSNIKQDLDSSIRIQNDDQGYGNVFVLEIPVHFMDPNTNDALDVREHKSEDVNLRSRKMSYFVYNPEQNTKPISSIQVTNTNNNNNNSQNSNNHNHNNHRTSNAALLHQRIKQNMKKTDWNASIKTILLLPQSVKREHKIPSTLQGQGDGVHSVGGKGSARPWISNVKISCSDDSSDDSISSSINSNNQPKGLHLFGRRKLTIGSRGSRGSKRKSEHSLSSSQNHLQYLSDHLSDHYMKSELSHQDMSVISIGGHEGDKSSVHKEGGVGYPLKKLHSRLPRALIVDDVAMNRKMLCRLLDGYCDVLDTAEDGQIAVDKVKESIENSAPYDLVLMDYQMPRMDGPTAARNMRELGLICPIIGVTGNVLNIHIKTFLSNGADQVLQKPLDFSVLMQTLLGLGINLNQ